MLRRRFLLVLGSLVALLMATAMTAIVLLHAVLMDLDALGVQTVEGTRLVVRLGSDATQLQVQLSRRLGTGTSVYALSGSGPAPAIDGGPGATIATMRGHLQEVAAIDSLRRQEGAAALFARIEGLIDEIAGYVSRLDAQSPQADPQVVAAALAVFPRLRAEMVGVDDALHRGLEEEQGRVVYRFRLIALGLGLVFLVVINVSVMAVSRIMSMVLKPVDALVEASRVLAREDFGHRVRLERDDEFGELGRAYNSLAEQLQSNERRKIETMHQVARMLSHEVNNALSIIEMQLAMLSRATPMAGRPAMPGADVPAVPAGAANGAVQAERLSQIRQSLGRISRTVEALTRVRRIVLTDYLAGVSMLDLERSVEDIPSQDGPGIPQGTSREGGPGERSGVIS